jgi:hypothetical protein
LTRTIDSIYTAAHDWCDRHIDTAVVEDRIPRMELARNLSEQGWDGTKYYNGVRYRQRDTPDFDTPYIARGIGSDLGMLERLARTSPQIMRIMETVQSLVRSAVIGVEAPARTAESYSQMADVMAGTLSQSNAGMRGGIRRALIEQAHSVMIGGFGIHQIVDNPDGTIKKLAMRRTNTVHRWIFDGLGQECIAVEFRDEHGAFYTIPVEHLLIAQALPIGDDMESYGPLRVAAPWIMAKQMLAQLWHARMNKYASPIIGIESGGTSDTSDDIEVVNIISETEANDFLVLTLKRGQKLTSVDLGGQSGEFESALKYCDEQILMPFAAEGALIGLNGKGAYNLADSKDDAEMAIATSLVRKVVDAYNGVDNLPWQGINRRVIDNVWGEPVIPGDYPMLSISMGEDEAPLQDIINAAQQGLIDVTPEVKQHIMQRLKLPTQDIQE